MTSIEVIVPARARKWQKVLVERLRAAGDEVSVRHAPARDWPLAVRTTLGLERWLLRRGRDTLTATGPIADSTSAAAPTLRLDLTGSQEPTSVPLLQIAFDDSLSSCAAVAALAAGRLPRIDLVRDGTDVVSSAAPMVDRREAIGLGVDDVFARAITLTLAAARTERSSGRPAALRPPRSGWTFAATYLTCAVPRLAAEIVRRLHERDAHWMVGYRLLDGPGAAETGRLGTGWRVLPNVPDHFFADPFPFEWDGQRYIFVEDYPHATRKGVISVATIDNDGNATLPEPVLEESFHLSYPQVFEHDGHVWMLPEASNSGKLILYRAEQFPGRWHRMAVLAEGEISDATLLRRDGRFWIFATLRDGYGSTSDVMIVLHAEHLTGPWRRHPRNPILIDRSRARPGGAFVYSGDRLLLPVQDGTLCYGGGLGLAELLRLDDEHVEFAEPVAIDATGDWPWPRIHTLNRFGPLEVVDGIAPMPLRPRQAASRNSAS